MTSFYGERREFYISLLVNCMSRCCVHETLTKTCDKGERKKKKKKRRRRRRRKKKKEGNEIHFESTTASHR